MGIFIIVMHYSLLYIELKVLQMLLCCLASSTLHFKCCLFHNLFRHICLCINVQMSGSRMKVAGRFKPCVHMGCFDLDVFVELNQRSRKASF